MCAETATTAATAACRGIYSCAQTDDCFRSPLPEPKTPCSIPEELFIFPRLKSAGHGGAVQQANIRVAAPDEGRGCTHHLVLLGCGFDAASRDLGATEKGAQGARMQVETLKNKKQNVEKWQRFDTITFLFVAKQSGSPPSPHTKLNSIQH